MRSCIAPGQSINEHVLELFQICLQLPLLIASFHLPNVVEVSTQTQPDSIPVARAGILQEVDTGDSAVATARIPGIPSLEHTTPKNYHAVKLAITELSDMQSAFITALDKFRRVDLVNNAGQFLRLDQCYEAGCGGHEGLEAQRGVIYCTSKWAVEGFTEAVSHEVKPEWNIHFTCVEPSGFHTHWSGRFVDFLAQRHPAYDHIIAEEAMAKRNGSIVGDPIKGVTARYQLAVLKELLLKVIVGADTYKAIMAKIEAYGEKYRRFEG